MTMAKWGKRHLSSEESPALCRQNRFKWEESGLCWVIVVEKKQSHSQDLGQIGQMVPLCLSKNKESFLGKRVGRGLGHWHKLGPDLHLSK